MTKAKLIKKDSPGKEQLEKARRQRKSRAPQVTPARTALEVTTEWINKRRVEHSGAREAFANLFADADPQSA